MKQLHLIIQPKGGAGKSFVAIHLIQYLRDQGQSVDAFDLDSANNTLSQFSALEAVTVDIQSEEDPQHVDHRKFDVLLESLTASKAGHLVIDIGASIVQDFINHLRDLDFFSLTEELDLKVTIHTPVSGGQGLLDNLGGLKTIHDYIQGKSEYVIWANPYFGELSAKGITLENMKSIRAIKTLKGIVFIPKWASDPQEGDVNKMVTLKLTYDEVQDSPEFGFFNKTRLKKVKENFYSLIEVVGLIPLTKKTSK